MFFIGPFAFVIVYNSICQTLIILFGSQFFVISLIWLLEFLKLILSCQGLKLKWRKLVVLLHHPSRRYQSFFNLRLFTHLPNDSSRHSLLWTLNLFIFCIILERFSSIAYHSAILFWALPTLQGARGGGLFNEVRPRKVIMFLCIA